MVGSELKKAVGQFVRQCPSRSRVFERLNIDYCCGGQVSLLDACLVRDLEPEEVLQELLDCPEPSQTLESDDALIDADAMSLTDLADHIQESHHGYLKAELPRLDQMTKKVAGVHGDRNPRLRELREEFVKLRDELEPHMTKEERLIFPIIRQLESEEVCHAEGDTSLAGQVEELEHEHDQAGESLAKLRAAAGDFVPPEWACNTYRAMLDGLAQLEQDMHQHVHKENNVLFRKARQLETERSRR